MENLLTCALPLTTRKAWNMRFGQKVRVTNLTSGVTVIAIYEDTGPGKRACSKNVIVDLTPAAFEALGGKLKDGKIKVKVEKVN